MLSRQFNRHGTGGVCDIIIIQDSLKAYAALCGCCRGHMSYEIYVKALHWSWNEYYSRVVGRLPQLKYVIIASKQHAAQ